MVVLRGHGNKFANIEQSFLVITITPPSRGRMAKHLFDTAFLNDEFKSFGRFLFKDFFFDIIEQIPEAGDLLSSGFRYQIFLIREYSRDSHFANTSCWDIDNSRYIAQTFFV